MTREGSAIGSIAWAALLSALIGAAYAFLERGSPLNGALAGFLMGAALSFLERIVLNRWADPWLRRMPFAAHLCLRVALYVVVVLTLLFGASPLLRSPSSGNSVSSGDIAFALCVCVAFNLVAGMNFLLGPGVLIAFVAGRYHRPRREERALLYIDLRSSTTIAERLGEERFLDLLNAFYADLSACITAQGGEVHKYVGDELIAVWRLRDGRVEPRPLRACFAALDRLSARGTDYERKFGQRVAFRAALHAGTVVLGELGSMKKEIALIGDAMNTTARILEACRDTGEAVLASAALMARCGDPPSGVTARRLSPIALRGKAQPLELVALERAGAGSVERGPL